MEALNIILSEIVLVIIALTFGYFMQSLFNHMFKDKDDFNNNKNER
jgi:hypothetical protein